jgi:ribosomal protein L24E
MPEQHQEQKSFCFFFFRKRRVLFFSEEKNQKTFVPARVPRYGTWPERGMLTVG